MLLAVSVPNHPNGLSIAPPWNLPLEFPLFVIASLFWWKKTRDTFSSLAALVVTGLIILQLLDFGFYLAFDRTFNFMRDGHLLTSAMNLLLTGFGIITTTLVVIATLMVALLVIQVVKYSLQMLNRTGHTHFKTKWRVTIAVLVLSFFALISDQFTPQFLSFDSRVLAQLSDKNKDSQLSQKRTQVLENAIENVDSLISKKPRFHTLADHDVILIFVESYGRSYLDNKVFSQSASAAIEQFEEDLKKSSAHVRSFWINAPVTGGQSWLSHTTLHSGVTIEKQSDYMQLISSNLPSLARLFNDAGWTSIGLIPGIQFEWPEGSWYGFDQLSTYRDFNYQGKRFGYITVPDQFTLAHLEQLAKQSNESIMATVALLSSHAPWSEVPKKLAWSSLGDGSVFDGSNRYYRHENLLNIASLKQYYAKSIRYSLQVIGDFISRYNRDALFIVIGDHEPAALIGGLGNSGAVPAHFISRNKTLLSKLPTTGAYTVMPSSESPPINMAEIRNLFIAAYD